MPGPKVANLQVLATQSFFSGSVPQFGEWSRQHVKEGKTWRNVAHFLSRRLLYLYV